MYVVGWKRRRRRESVVGRVLVAFKKVEARPLVRPRGAVFILRFRSRVGTLPTFTPSTPFEEPQSHAQNSPFGVHTLNHVLLPCAVPLKNLSNAPLGLVLPFSPSQVLSVALTARASPHAFLAHSATHDITVHVLTIARVLLVGPRPSWGPGASESMLGDYGDTRGFLLPPLRTLPPLQVIPALLTHHIEFNVPRGTPPRPPFQLHFP